MTTCCAPFEDDDEYWLEQRLEKTERMIEAYEDAITELSAGTVVQYSLDTGQTRQSVTKAQLPSLMNTLKLWSNDALAYALGSAKVPAAPPWGFPLSGGV